MGAGAGEYLPSPSGRGAGGEGLRDRDSKEEKSSFPSMTRPHPNPLPEGEGTRCRAGGYADRLGGCGGALNSGRHPDRPPAVQLHAAAANLAEPDGSPTGKQTLRRPPVPICGPARRPSAMGPHGLDCRLGPRSRSRARHASNGNRGGSIRFRKAGLPRLFGPAAPALRCGRPAPPLLTLAPSSPSSSSLQGPPRHTSSACAGCSRDHGLHDPQRVLADTSPAFRRTAKSCPIAFRPNGTAAGGGATETGTFDFGRQRAIA